MAESVKVVVRVRPFNDKEKERGCGRIIKMDTNRGEVSVTNPKAKEDPKLFVYDCVFDTE